MTKGPSFRENITTRYGAAEKGTYDRVMALAKRRGMPKSRVQLYLIQQGLKSENCTLRKSNMNTTKEGLNGR